MGYLACLGVLAVSALWAPIIVSHTNTADTVCPAKQVKVRYPVELADYHNGSPDMRDYRIAYCKPTGINWVAIREYERSLNNGTH